MKHTLEQQLYEKEKKSKPNPAKAAQVTPTTTEKSNIEELKFIVQQLVSKVDSYRYDRERQQTSGSYREPHRGYQQGYRGTNIEVLRKWMYVDTWNVVVQLFVVVC
jgi:hypothetical protein